MKIGFSMKEPWDNFCYDLAQYESNWIEFLERLLHVHEDLSAGSLLGLNQQHQHLWSWRKQVKHDVKQIVSHQKTNIRLLLQDWKHSVITAPTALSGLCLYFSYIQLTKEVGSVDVDVQPGTRFPDVYIYLHLYKQLIWSFAGFPADHLRAQQWANL